MKRLGSALLIAACALAGAAPRWVPKDKDKKEPGRARITIYHVAPGKHLDFLRWMAAQDEVAKEAGVASVQLYAHIDGDAWDYLGIAPVTTPEQDKKLDEIAAAKGLKTGLPGSLEFRQLLASHTDTFAAGPTSASDLVAQATK
jgi:hypothetical protein